MSTILRNELEQKFPNLFLIVKILAHDQIDKEYFFKLIERTFPRFSKEYKLIAASYELAKKVHEKDVRTSGERYFEHVRAVALILISLGVTNANVIAGALLHDATEDHGDEYPATTIANRTRRKVAELTGWVNKERFVHIEDGPDRNNAFLADFLQHAPRKAALIKLADRAHNIITLWDASDSKREEKIREIVCFYLPLARKHQFMLREMEECLQCLREKVTIMEPPPKKGEMADFSDDDIPF